MRGGRLAGHRAAGGIEGGMSTGAADPGTRGHEAVLDGPEAARGPSTSRRGTAAVAIKQRTDVCAVPAGGVVGEAVVAFVLADAVAREVRRRLAPGDAGGTSTGTWRAPVIVYLVGMPGAGKSVSDASWRVASVCPFVDLDAEIERATGSTVAEIFATKARLPSAPSRRGAREGVRHDPSVVACGGGVVLEPANRITLRTPGPAVFLDVPLDLLRSRVRPPPSVP